MSDDPYAADRYDPATRGIPPIRNGWKLRFNGSSLSLIGEIEGKVHTYPAVSGKPGSLEPLPEGRYWVNPAEFKSISVRMPWTFAQRVLKNRDRVDRAFESSFIDDQEAWGWWRLLIHPFPDTHTRDPATGRIRGGFFIHGGSEPGSGGCIDLTNFMSRFHRDLVNAALKFKDRNDPLWMFEEPVCYCELTVTYPGTDFPNRPLSG